MRKFVESNENFVDKRLIYLKNWQSGQKIIRRDRLFDAADDNVGALSHDRLDALPRDDLEDLSLVLVRHDADHEDALARHELLQSGHGQAEGLDFRLAEVVLEAVGGRADGAPGGSLDAKSNVGNASVKRVQNLKFLIMNLECKFNVYLCLWEYQWFYDKPDRGGQWSEFFLQ